jgi:hypothetical protein
MFSLILVQRRTIKHREEGPNNLEFDYDVIKVCSKIVFTRNETQVLPNDLFSSLTFNSKQMML